MTDRFRITLAQLNPTVGDLAGNAALARRAWEEGKAAGADLVVLAEMFITGYQAQDLIVKPAFVAAAQAELAALRGELERLNRHRFVRIHNSMPRLLLFQFLRGLAFGFGSMRPLLQEGVRLGYMVRDVAPNATLFANIGVVQARDASTQQIADMVGVTGCDALCVHLNPAMEVVQPEGKPRMDFDAWRNGAQPRPDELFGDV